MEAWIVFNGSHALLRYQKRKTKTMRSLKVFKGSNMWTRWVGYIVIYVYYTVKCGQRRTRSMSKMKVVHLFVNMLMVLSVILRCGRQWGKLDPVSVTSMISRALYAIAFHQLVTAHLTYHNEYWKEQRIWLPPLGHAMISTTDPTWSIGTRLPHNQALQMIW